MEFENTIDLLEAEIDSLKDAYKNVRINEEATIYSSRILEHKKAINLLKKHQDKQLNMHDVSMQSEQFNCDGCRWYNSCALRIDYNNVRCEEFENN